MPPKRRKKFVERRHTCRRAADRYKDRRSKDLGSTILGGILMLSSLATHAFVPRSGTIDWFSIIIAVLGGLLFDTKKVVAGIRARFDNDKDSSSLENQNGSL